MTFYTGSEGHTQFNKVLNNYIYIEMLKDKKVSCEQKENITAMLNSNLEDDNILARNIIDTLKNK